MKFDSNKLKLYLVVSSDITPPNISFIEMIKSTINGGVTMVQLREKNMSTKIFIALACQLKKILTPLKIPLIINDRLDVVLASDADGIHVGQNDISYNYLIKFLPKSKIIGLTVENTSQVEEAQDLEVDYLGVSSIFETKTKNDYKKLWGTEKLKKIKEISRHPLVAIGGINSTNIKEVVDTKVDGVAVVSAICSALNPYMEAKKLKKIIDGN